MGTTLSKCDVLLFDEQERFHSPISRQLHNNGINGVIIVNDRRRLNSIMTENPVQIVVFGLYTPSVDSRELIRNIIKSHPETKIIAVSTTNNQDSAAEYIQLGVYDYMTQPLDVKKLVSNVTACLKPHTSLTRKPAASQRNETVQGTAEAFASIITGDRRMQSIFRYVEAVAPSSQTVMITGETGTGKELIARAIHSTSCRTGDFVSVNVAGLDDIMFSDTLFGHNRGAFTGADRERKGLVNMAAGGTLFLDEIGDLSIASQVKLLRLLQEDEYYQLGSDAILSSNARIIVATNSCLEKNMVNGLFRSDLYYRLCSHHIHLPALRERKQDIPLLVDYFSRQAAHELGKPLPKMSADELDSLMHYDFPGNVRELKGIVSNAVAIAFSGSLTFPYLQKNRLIQMPTSAQIDYGSLSRTSGRMPTLAEAEEYLIKEALRVSGGNQRTAAAILGISRQALNKRLQREAGHISQNRSQA